MMFPNATQAEELTEYIDRHRPLRSIGELAMIKSIDPIRLQLLMCFTYIGEETDKKGYPKLGDILLRRQLTRCWSATQNSQCLLPLECCDSK